MFRKGILLLMVLLLLAGQTVIYAEAEKTITSPEDAAELVEGILGEDPASLDGQYRMTDQMESAVGKGGGFEGLAKSLVFLGKVKEIQTPYESEMSGMRVFRVPCVFGFLKLDLAVSVDAEGCLAGLVTLEFTGEEKKDTEADTTDTEADDTAFDTVELAVPVPSLNGELPGTLTVPEGEGPFPLVILVHGSGPNDRDETIGLLKPFRDLAEGLARNGIAVYRYDKRTFVYGEELSSDIHLTLQEETIDDAVMAVQVLAQQPGIDPSRIFVLGHSLGAGAVPAIDQELQKEEAKACGYILMAGSPRGLDVLVKEQTEYLYSLMAEVTEEQQASKDALMADLDRLHDLDALADTDMVMGAYKAYWEWLDGYDILQTAKQITVPCLLLQGEEDYQVTMEDFHLWEEEIGDKDNWMLKSYPGLTHAFVPGQKEDGAAAYQKAGNVDDDVIEDITAFVKKP